MIDLLKRLFESAEHDAATVDDTQVQLAAASLLVELMRADHKVSQDERNAFLRAVDQALDVPVEDMHTLIDDALAAADAATSTYEFTRLINDNFSPAQKAGLIEAMWMIAYADGDLDKYEEHLIRKVTELIYVSHKDFIRLKLAARARSEAD